MRIFDNGGKTFDRYTIQIGRDIYLMSANPLSPQGVNQYSFLKKYEHLEGAKNKELLGKEIIFNVLPEAVKKAIQQKIIRRV